MAKKKRVELSPLGPLTWGESVHMAYRRARALYGQTYVDVARRINQLVPVSDPTLTRLEAYKDVPSQERVRRIAYFALLAYGHNPEDFGLTKEACGVTEQMAKVAADLLIPLSPCFTETAA